MHNYSSFCVKYSSLAKIRKNLKKEINIKKKIKYDLPLSNLIEWVFWKQTKKLINLAKKQKKINNKFNKFIFLNTVSSKTSLLLHTFIFWNFYFNSISSLFNKKSTSVANNVNSLGALKRQLPRPITKAFQKQKKIIARANSGILAEPLLKNLISENFLKDKKNEHILKHTKLAKLAIYIIMGYNLHNNPWFKSKSTCGATNKSVFSLNQLAMEKMIKI